MGAYIKSVRSDGQEKRCARATHMWRATSQKTNPHACHKAEARRCQEDVTQQHFVVSDCGSAVVQLLINLCKTREGRHGDSGRSQELHAIFRARWVTSTSARFLLIAPSFRNQLQSLSLLHNSNGYSFFAKKPVSGLLFHIITRAIKRTSLTRCCCCEITDWTTVN